MNVTSRQNPTKSVSSIVGKVSGFRYDNALLFFLRKIQFNEERFCKLRLYITWNEKVGRKNFAQARTTAPSNFCNSISSLLLSAKFYRPHEISEDGNFGIMSVSFEVGNTGEWPAGSRGTAVYITSLLMKRKLTTDDNGHFYDRDSCRWGRSERTYVRTNSPYIRSQNALYKFSLDSQELQR